MKKFCRSCKKKLEKSNLYNDLCQRCYKRKQVIQQREKQNEESRQERFEELKQDAIEGTNCFFCQGEENLIECKILIRNNPRLTSHRIKQIKFLPSNFVCSKCFKGWVSFYEEINERLLKKVTTFIEIPVKDQFVFCIRKGTIYLVFFKESIKSEDYAAIHKLKNLKTKVYYAKNKGYDIPYWKPYGKEYFFSKVAAPIFYHSKLDKYGNPKKSV